jgi:hypothetical protein
MHLSNCTTKLGYRPDRFTGEGDDTRIWLRSDDCSILVGDGVAQCSFCRDLLAAKPLQTLATRAQDALHHTAFQYLTQVQLIKKLQAVIAEKNALQLKVRSILKPLLSNIF